MLTVVPGEGGSQTLSMAYSGSKAWKNEYHLPLGQLGTDQVGYASCDLSLIADLQALIPVVADASQGPSPADLVLSLRRLRLAPFGDEYLAFEALDAGEDNGEVVVVRHEFTDNDFAGRMHTYSDCYFGSSHDNFSGDELDIYVVAPDQPVRWKDIRGFTGGLTLSPTSAFERDAALRNPWRLPRMRVIGLSDDGTTGLLLDKAFDHEFSPSDTHQEIPVSPLLMDHLDAFTAHHQAAPLADSDPVTTIADARLGPDQVIHDTAVVAATMSL